MFFSVLDVLLNKHPMFCAQIVSQTYMAASKNELGKQTIVSGCPQIALTFFLP